MGESITAVEIKNTAKKYSIRNGLKKNMNNAGIKCPAIFHGW
jgi:hypothetical protein